MVACPQCMARFAATREAEQVWYEHHLARLHGPQRRQVVGSRRATQARVFPEFTQRRAS